MKKNLKWIGLVLMSCGVLVGCGEGGDENSASSDEKLEQVEAVFDEASKEQDERMNDLMPPGVQDGRVSQDTYLEVYRLIDEVPLWGTRNASYISEIKFDYDVMKTDDFQTNYNKFLNDYDIFIKGFNGNPSTSADFELNEHIISVVFNTEAYIDEMRMYIKDGSSLYNENTSKYLNEIQISLEALVNSMDKYELFTE